METTLIKEVTERTYNAPKNINDDQHFFSAYLNQATNNMFNIIAHINDVMVGSSRPTKDSKQIFECGVFQILKDGQLNEKEQPIEKIAGIINQLNKRFPFLNWMVEKELYNRYEPQEANRQEVKPDNKDYYKVLHTLISYLIHYRNFFTHYPPNDIEFSKDLIKYLRASFDTSRNAIIERFGYTADDVKHLIRSNKKSSKRKKVEINGVKVELDDEDFHYSFYNEDYALSDKGIIYLTCLFLEPRYSQLFLKQLYGF